MQKPGYIGRFFDFISNIKPKPDSGQANYALFKEGVNVITREVDRFVAVRLAIAFLCVIIAAVAAALTPFVLKLMIDELSPTTAGAVLAVPVFLLAAYVITNWLSRAINELRGLLFGTAEQRLFRRLSRFLFSHIMTLPLRFHLDRKTGAIGPTLEQGMQGYRLILQHAVFTVLPALVEIAAMTFILASLFSAPFLIIFALSVIAYGVVFAHGAARILSASRDVSATKINAHAILTDSILNYETVKLFTAENEIRARYDAMLARSEETWVEFYRRRTVNGLSVAVVFAAGLAATMSLGASGVARGEISIGDFVLLNAYILQIARPVEMLGFAFRDIGQGVAFIEKLLDLLREPNETSPQNPPMRVYAGAASVSFENISFGYNDERQVLQDVSFNIPNGKTVALVGPSGSGKSSMVRLLTRFYDPDAGTIRIDGDPVDKIPLEKVREMIAVVPQDTILFNTTIAENIGFGATGKATEVDIRRAARLAHLDRFIDTLPKGYETIVGERGLKLSGGEKQRVAIARAALKRPRLFIFDEATSALDTETERHILQNMIEVSEGVTTLMIAHRLSTIIHADEIIVLQAGTVRERGAHESLLAEDGLYADMWRAQNTKTQKQPA